MRRQSKRGSTVLDFGERAFFGDVACGMAQRARDRARRNDYVKSAFRDARTGALRLPSEPVPLQGPARGNMFSGGHDPLASSTPVSSMDYHHLLVQRRDGVM